MDTLKDKIYAFAAGYGLFAVLFMSYEYYMRSQWQVVSTWGDIDYTQQSIGNFMLPLITALPGILIGYFSKSGLLKYGVIFGVLTSVSAIVLDSISFNQLFGSDLFFMVSFAFSGFFVPAVLACGFGAALAKNR